MAELLEKLSVLNGVSGNETTVRNFISTEIKNDTDDIIVDSMGNLIALKKGADSTKKLAVTVNMDEAGFIISGITDKGYLKFKAVGEIDPRKIISKKVVIGESRVKGVIGMKAIHLQTRSERENVVAVSKLFIDIGAKNRTQAEKYVKLGDYVSFDTDFSFIGSNAKGKALDRSGVCTALINALKDEYQYDMYACFLTQHEVGARGAKIVSHRITPDAVLTVSTADTADMHGCDKSIGGVSLGAGAAVNYSDKLVITDKSATDFLICAASEEKINLQLKALKPYSSDAGAMQTGAYGTICLSAAIPCRYSHSPVSIMSLADINCMTEYIRLFLKKIGEVI